MIQKIIQYGFVLSIKIGHPLTDKKLETLIDKLIGYIEEKELLCGGGYSNKHIHFFICAKKGSATNSHRQQIRGWLKKYFESKEVCIGRLVDAQS